MFSIKKLILNSILLSSILPFYYSQAATTTANLTVTATSLSTCLLSTTPLAFGNYSTIQVDQTATITVTCSQSTPFTIALNPGSNASSGFNRRMFFSGTNYLAYQIYTDTSRTQIWGDGTLSTATVSGTGTGLAQNFTAYGRIAAGLYPAAGAYTDTVIITVTY